MDDERDFYLLPEDYEGIDISEFADPGGRSSLYAATEDDPRIYPCPDCGQPNRLTLRDKRAHHCCNSCADRNEAGY